MQRKAYAPLIPSPIKVSIKNEPLNNDNLFTSYPDMYSAYKAFSSAFNISERQFILTNGCENAARWALLFCKEHYGHITIESPTWSMAEILCEAFHIPYDKFVYHYTNNKFKPQFTTIDSGYITDTFNNLFKHYNPHINKGIIDETYTLNYLMHNKTQYIPENIIIIGSFSKVIGCGYRLGYILFNAKHYDYFNMIREQYINTAAAQYLIEHQYNLKDIINVALTPCGIKTTLPVVSRHANYITVQATTVPIPHKIFKVDGISFCRIGIGNIQQINNKLANDDVRQEIYDNVENNSFITEMDSLRTIVLNISEVCQLHCDICPHGHGYLPYNNMHYMDLKVIYALKHHLDKIHYKGIISISGMGEPFLHKDIIKITQILNNYHIKILTNGLIKRPDYNMLPNNCKIYVSVHDMSKLKQIRKNLKGINIPIKYRNHDIAHNNCQLILTNRGGCLKSQHFNNKQCCYFPFYKMMIDVDGSYLLCADDWLRYSKNALNVFNTSIADYFTKHLRYYKTTLIKKGRILSPCSQCNANGTLMGEKAAQWYKQHVTNNTAKSRTNI